MIIVSSNPRIVRRATSTKVNLVHFLGKEMDSKTATITEPVNSLEAFLILAV
jgi:hypothetical protein